MWDIIVWNNEDAIDVVPSIWCTNDEKTSYKYPINLTQPKIKKIIVECSNLETNYKVSCARCLKSNIENFNKAQEYCKKGAYTSHIETEESEDEIENMGKRITKKPRKILDSESEISGQSSEEEASRFNRKKRFTIPNSTSQHALTHVVPDCNTNNLTPTSAIGTPMGTPSIRSSFSSVSTSTNIISDNTLARLFSSISDINYEIKEIKKKLTEISNLQGRYQETNHCNNDLSLEEDDTLKDLPCETQEEIDSLEEKLNQNSTYKRKIIQLLWLVGGSTVQKTVNLGMNKILGKVISVQYSGQGKKKKLAFSKLTLYQLIFEAVRMRHSKACDEEIKKAISLYLATAKSRLPPSERKNQVSKESDV